MKIKVLLIQLAVFLSACNQSKVNYLEAQIDSLNSKITEINLQANFLQKELEDCQTPKNQIRQFSDNEIIQLIKNEMSFNCPKTKIKDFVVRQINENTYEIRFYQNRYQIDSNKNISYSGWDMVLSEIQILPGDRFIFKITAGVYCQS